MAQRWYRWKVTPGRDFERTWALYENDGTTAVVTTGGTATAEVNPGGKTGVTTTYTLTQASGITLGGGTDANEVEFKLTGTQTASMVVGTVYYTDILVTLAGGEKPEVAGMILDVEQEVENG